MKTKNILLTFSFLICLSIGAKAQIAGRFYRGTDYYGNSFIYFDAINNTEQTLSIKIVAINEPMAQQNVWYCNLCSGQGFTIGPFERWTWQSGEKLVVVYPNGYTQQWEYTSSIPPPFTGRRYLCPWGGCLCKKYEKKSTYNSDCKNCDHPKHP